VALTQKRFEVLSRKLLLAQRHAISFCGCYSRGELSSLADGLIELADAENYKDTSYPRLLTLMLLGRLGLRAAAFDDRATRKNVARRAGA